MFLVQDTSTPGSQCWLVAGQDAIPVNDAQTIQNFTRVGFPLLRMDPQAITSIAQLLTPPVH